jgi:hypothetical protein
LHEEAPLPLDAMPEETMNRSRALLLLAVLVVGGFAGFGLRTVLASGIPDMNPLYYSGTLTESGSLVNGQRAITINLWSDGMTGTTPICQTVVSAAQVTNGRFRIALADACKTALNQNKNAWVEVIDGATTLGRSKIGAVPYAVEADHAPAADHAATADSATNAGHAMTADSATNALTTVAGVEINSADSFGPQCIMNPDSLACSLAANRKCKSMGYKGGWIVGESSNGAMRSALCIK